MPVEEKFVAMVALVQCDRETRMRLLKEPELVLLGLGIDPDLLNSAYDEDALRRAGRVLAQAALSRNDDAIAALKKLGPAAERGFEAGFEVEIEPFGVTLLERTPEITAQKWTAKGTVKCTWGPWDGCRPDVDW